MKDIIAEERNSDFEEAEKLADASDALREIGEIIFGNVRERNRG